MPELPDVEGYRRVLADNAVGRRVRAVEVLDLFGSPESSGPEMFQEGLGLVRVDRS